LRLVGIVVLVRHVGRNISRATLHRCAVGCLVRWFRGSCCAYVAGGWYCLCLAHLFRGSCTWHCLSLLLGVLVVSGSVSLWSGGKSTRRRRPAETPRSTSSQPCPSRERSRLRRCQRRRRHQPPRLVVGRHARSRLPCPRLPT
jgi:hypothetical protein